MSKFLDSLAIGWFTFVVVFCVGAGGFLLGQYIQENPWPFIGLAIAGTTMLAGGRVKKIMERP